MCQILKSKKKRFNIYAIARECQSLSITCFRHIHNHLFHLFTQIYTTTVCCVSMCTDHVSAADRPPSSCSLSSLSSSSVMPVGAQWPPPARSVRNAQRVACIAGRHRQLVDALLHRRRVLPVIVGRLLTLAGGAKVRRLTQVPAASHELLKLYFLFLFAIFVE